MLSDFLRWVSGEDYIIPVVILNNKKYLPENNYFGIFEDDKIPYFFKGLK